MTSREEEVCEMERHEKREGSEVEAHRRTERDTQAKVSQEAGELQAPELLSTEKTKTNQILPSAAPCNFPEIFYNFPWSPTLTAGRCQRREGPQNE